MVKRFSNCAEAAKAPLETMLASCSLAQKPWQRVHIDYAGPFKGHYFLATVDAYSKWPEMLTTDSSSSNKTIALLC